MKYNGTSTLVTQKLELNFAMDVIKHKPLNIYRSSSEDTNYVCYTMCSQSPSAIWYACDFVTVCKGKNVQQIMYFIWLNIVR